MAEIVKCPSCDKQLQVPEEFFGKTVQCPECKQTFLAQPTVAAAPAPVPSPPPGTDLAPAWEKRPSRGDARDDDDRPRKRRSAEDDEEENRPRSRRPADDGDEVDRSRSRRHLTPHRGGMILAFGIISIVGVMSLIFGPIAWVMGNADLKEMRDGRMDPSGEGQTNTGRILGMIATLLHIVIIVITCAAFALCIPLGMIGGGAKRR